jgi:hypothetical protein
MIVVHRERRDIKVRARLTVTRQGRDPRLLPELASGKTRGSGERPQAAR